MAYDKLTWVSGQTPLSAYNFNHIELGIYNNSVAIETLQQSLASDYYTKVDADARYAKLSGNNNFVGQNSFTGATTFMLTENAGLLCDFDCGELYKKYPSLLVFRTDQSLYLSIGKSESEPSSSNYCLSRLDFSTFTHCDLGSTSYKWRNLYLTGNISNGTNSFTVNQVKTFMESFPVVEFPLGATTGTLTDEQFTEICKDRCIVKKGPDVYYKKAGDDGSSSTHITFFRIESYSGISGTFTITEFGFSVLVSTKEYRFYSYNWLFYSKSDTDDKFLTKQNFGYVIANNTYNSGYSYNSGDTVYYNGYLYKALVNIAAPAGNFDYSKWTTVTVESLIWSKQDLLESGVNIKTVGGASVLGTGNVPVGTKLYKHVYSSGPVSYTIKKAHLDGTVTTESTSQGGFSIVAISTRSTPYEDAAAFDNGFYNGTMINFYCSYFKNATVTFTNAGLTLKLRITSRNVHIDAADDSTYYSIAELTIDYPTFTVTEL